MKNAIPKVSESEREAVIGWFPDIEKIKDLSLREKVLRTWVRIWRESPFKNLTDAPNLPTELDAGTEDVVSHINAVARAVQAIASQVQEEYHISIDFDVLLAGVLLHDVDKPVTLEKKRDIAQYSDLANKIPHGVYGACVAFEEGLPIEVIHIIVSHTPNTKINPNSIEAVIIQTCESTKILPRSMAEGGTYHLKISK